VRKARDPSLFGAGGFPDTLDGRFEALVTFAALALVRLRATPEAAPLAQAFVDHLFRDVDSGLREAGVGDLSVSRRMHRLAGDFYGRLDAYAAALGNSQALEAALVRNVAGLSAEQARAHAAQMIALAARQANLDVLALLEDAAWTRA
jgi:cytochrome b pre-mRNA-processing protein 3